MKISKINTMKQVWSSLAMLYHATTTSLTNTVPAAGGSAEDLLPSSQPAVLQSRETIEDACLHTPRKKYGKANEKYSKPGELFARLKNFAPRLKNFAPRLKNFAPRLKNFAPRLENFAPSLKNFAPSLKNFAPRLENFAPRLENFVFRKCEKFRGV
jgi:hypothetical protein